MSMEEKTFVGYGYGRFEDDNKQWRDYCNVFVLEEFYGSQNADYHFGGQKAVKYRCVSPDVFKNIPVGSRVQCWFDGRGRISAMQAIDKK